MTEVTQIKARLRETAGKATAGEWMAATRTSSIVGTPVIGLPEGRAIANAHQGVNDAAYIAAACPANITLILDALDAAESRATESALSELAALGQAQEAHLAASSMVQRDRVEGFTAHITNLESENARLREALRYMMSANRPCSRDIGAPGSVARQQQDNQRTAYAVAKAAMGDEE